jgi:hypothetical protein
LPGTFSADSTITQKEIDFADCERWAPQDIGSVAHHRMQGNKPVGPQTPLSSGSADTLSPAVEAKMSELEGGAHQGVSSPDLLEKAEPENVQPPETFINIHDSLVDFDGPDDPEDPRNWSKRRRWAITASMGMMTFVVCLELQHTRLW